jgi:very-short-patch-repair endonuclease
MELKRVAWSWETALARLLARDSTLGKATRRSCRPIAAERAPDGRLLLVIGCWWPPDLAALGTPLGGQRLDDALSEFLDDQLRTLLVPWPGGMAPPQPGAEPEEVDPPDLLHGLPPEARETARVCESALERLLYACAWTRGLRLSPQHKVLNYRLDFALPRARLAAEVIGWEGPQKVARWEREQHLDAESWRVFYFSGAEVHRQVNRCVDALLAAARA